jgi:hypothetical protein
MLCSRGLDIPGDDRIAVASLARIDAAIVVVSVGLVIDPTGFERRIERHGRQMPDVVVVETVVTSLSRSASV